MQQPPVKVAQRLVQGERSDSPSIVKPSQHHGIQAISEPPTTEAGKNIFARKRVPTLVAMTLATLSMAAQMAHAADVEITRPAFNHRYYWSHQVGTVGGKTPLEICEKYIQMLPWLSSWNSSTCNLKHPHNPFVTSSINAVSGFKNHQCKFYQADDNCSDKIVDPKVTIFKTADCPDSFVVKNHDLEGAPRTCKKSADLNPAKNREANPNKCPKNDKFVGDPIDSQSGNMYLAEVDYQGGDGLEFIRTYHSTADTATTGDMGGHWRHNYDRKVHTYLDPNQGLVAGTYAGFTNAEGKRIAFQYELDIASNTYQWKADADVKDKLQVYTQIVDGNDLPLGAIYASGGVTNTGITVSFATDNLKIPDTNKIIQVTGWDLTSPSGEVQRYTGDGRLSQIVDRNGVAVLTLVWQDMGPETTTRQSDWMNVGFNVPYSYSYGVALPHRFRLTSVTDRSGRMLTFAYAGDLISSVSVTKPGGGSQVIAEYDYEAYTPPVIPPYSQRFDSSEVVFLSARTTTNSNTYGGTLNSTASLEAASPQPLVTFFRLDTVTYPGVTLADGSSSPGTKTYVYNEADHINKPVRATLPAGYSPIAGVSRAYEYDRDYGTEVLSQPFAITGVETNGVRTGDWHYDIKGRAIKSSLGAVPDPANPVVSVPVGEVELDYDVTCSSTSLPCNGKQGSLVTEKNGSVATTSFRTFAAAQGVAYVNYQTQPAGSGCTAASSSATYNTDGTLSSSTDFSGNVATHQYKTDGSGLETDIKIKGKDNVVATHTSVSEWDTVLRLPKTVTEHYNSAATTESSTDAANNRVTRLEYYTIDQIPKAKYGKLKTKTVTAPGAVPRILTYDYYDTADKKRGLLKSITSMPKRGAENNVTTLEYYADDHSDAGNLSKVTAPDGQVTTYFNYNVWGIPQMVKAANGVVTKSLYNARGWVTKQVVQQVGAACDVNSVLPASLAGCLVTTYDYDINGRVVRATQPNGVSRYSHYDAAGRMDMFSDEAITGTTSAPTTTGNYTKITMDPQGKPTKMEMFEKGNPVAIQTHVVKYDELGRPMQDISAPVAP